MIAVIVAAAIGAASWWIMSDPVGDAARSAREQASSERVDRLDRATTEAEELPSGIGRLLDLYEQGTPMECTYTFADADGRGEGTGFFDGKRLRVSAMYQTNGETFVSNIINDGETMFVWGDSAQGEFAMQMPATEDDMMDMEADLDETVALNQEVSYQCREWNIDPSIYNPPSNIEFMDMGQMMQGMPAMGEMPSAAEMENMSAAEMEAMMEEMMQGTNQ